MAKTLSREHTGTSLTHWQGLTTSYSGPWVAALLLRSTQTDPRLRDPALSRRKLVEARVPSAIDHLNKDHWLEIADRLQCLGYVVILQRQVA